MANAFENVQQWFCPLELNFIEFALAPDHLRLYTAIEMQPLSWLGRLAGAALREHAAIRQHPFDEQFDAPATVLLAEQARRNDAGVVEYQQIAAPEQRRQIGKTPVFDVSGLAVQAQQPAGRTLGEWLLGNELRRELVEKIRLEQRTGPPDR